MWKIPAGRLTVDDQGGRSRPEILRQVTGDSMKKWIAWTAVFLGLAHASIADEPYQKASYWLSHGYRQVVYHRVLSKEVPSWAAHSLEWPITFQDESHEIGNSMAEFQSYGDGPYYHGGLDLRVSIQALVHTPVAGRIEAGHYGYTNNPDGSSAKFWTAWPGDGSSVYFEVAVITDDGYRFEFHHMDETRLSDEVMKILRQGSGRVKAGAVLGNTIAWPDGEYNHTHYNILAASGVQLNPEYYSPLLADHRAPEVSAVLASFQDGSVQDVRDGALDRAPDFFALAVVDHQDGNIYEHPPTYAAIRFEDGHSYAWDFRERLLGPDGKFPPIWNFFVESISSPSSGLLETSGGYGTGLSVVRLPVPAGAKGPYQIEVSDEAGNSTQFQGRIGH